MYHVFVQLDDCEFVTVACRDELEEAIHLIDGLNAYWPREYVVRDSEATTLTLRGMPRLNPNAVLLHHQLAIPNGQICIPIDVR
jgi:hypothetical protein